MDGEAHKSCPEPAAQWARHYGGAHGHVVFGHDAARGLQLEPHATGLDTGAVYGKHLSCLIVERGGGHRHVAKVRSFAQYAEPDIK